MRITLTLDGLHSRGEPIVKSLTAADDLVSSLGERGVMERLVPLLATYVAWELGKPRCYYRGPLKDVSSPTKEEMLAMDPEDLLRVLEDIAAP